MFGKADDFHEDILSSPNFFNQLTPFHYSGLKLGNLSLGILQLSQDRVRCFSDGLLSILFSSCSRTFHTPRLQCLLLHHTEGSARQRQSPLQPSLCSHLWLSTCYVHAKDFLLMQPIILSGVYHYPHQATYSTVGDSDMCDSIFP